MERILQSLKNNPKYSKNITCWKDVPHREGEYNKFPSEISPELIDILRNKGINNLYSHQAEAISKILNKKNVVIVTPTASGKTLCYNIPVVDQILKNDDTRALYTTSPVWSPIWIFSGTALPALNGPIVRPKYPLPGFFRPV